MKGRSIRPRRVKPERQYRKGDGAGIHAHRAFQEERRRASRLSSIPARTRVHIASSAGAFSLARIAVKARSMVPAAETAASSAAHAGRPAR